MGWVFFRAPDLSFAMKFLRIMFTGNNEFPLNSFYVATNFLTYSNLWIFIIGIVLSYPIFEKISQKIRYSKIESFLLIILFIVAYVFAMTSTFSPFIYFRF